jgi:alkylation response protein AidB-like acyl-CoA dehydrogenase
MSTYLELNKDLTPAQTALKAETHKFADEVLRPASLELDKLAPEDVIKKGSVMWDVFRAAYAAGYHTQSLPESLGGADLKPLERHIVAEEMGWGSADFAVGLGVAGFPYTFAAGVAALTANQKLMDDVVLPFAQDREAKYIGCWAITEPEHGSDSLLVGVEQFRDTNITFQVGAKQDGDDWVINGQKAAWVSLGTIATHALTFLTVDPNRGMAGGGVAIIPLDLPGVSKGPPLNKLGQRALNQGEIFFDDVRIPRHYMLVEPMTYPMTIDWVLSGANAFMGACFTGVARAALEEALAYCKQRTQGGKPLCEHQLVQKTLFDMFTKVEAARALSRAVQYSIAAKVFCTQMAFEVASDAVQLFGGMGLCKELLVEKLFRDARASMIEDGTNEVLSLAGARQIVDKY